MDATGEFWNVDIIVLRLLLLLTEAPCLFSFDRTGFRKNAAQSGKVFVIVKLYQLTVEPLPPLPFRASVVIPRSTGLQSANA